jgi:hypothetical protein
VNDLADQIVNLVKSRPGITTRQIVLVVRRRRADVLRALDDLERERILSCEMARYGARAWELWDRFPHGCAHLPGASTSEPGPQPGADDDATPSRADGNP